jgi:hypothetical protein
MDDRNIFHHRATQLLESVSFNQLLWIMYDEIKIFTFIMFGFKVICWALLFIFKLCMMNIIYSKQSSKSGYKGFSYYPVLHKYIYNCNIPADQKWLICHNSIFGRNFKNISISHNNNIIKYKLSMKSRMKYKFLLHA